MRAVFPESSVNVTYRRWEKLKELISPSLFPQGKLTTKLQSVVSTRGKKCDICDNSLVCRNEFTCKVTGNTYKVRGNLLRNSANVVYSISCKMCNDQYVGSAYKNNFKPRFRVNKSDINTGKDRCGVAKHFLTKCRDAGKLENIEVHIIEQVEEGDYDVESKLWCGEKYWQAQLFSLLHGKLWCGEKYWQAQLFSLPQRWYEQHMGLVQH